MLGEEGGYAEEQRLGGAEEEGKRVGAEGAIVSHVADLPPSWSRVLDPLAESLPDPEGMLRVAAGLDRSLRAEDVEIAGAVAGASGPFRRLMERDPAIVSEPVPIRRVAADRSPAGLRRSLLSELPLDAGGSQASAALGRWHRRAWLRLAADEALGRPVLGVNADLSTLAEVAVAAAFEIARAEVVERYGEPLSAAGRPCEHTVIGLGKLGSEELNYCSDVDLVVLYDSDEGRVGEGATTLHELHERLVREAVKLIDRRGATGLYRVDLGLRPEGRSGALSNSVDAAERYYETWGHTWERMAWLRARPVAGSLGLGRDFVATLRPFVYRRHLDEKALSELRNLKDVWAEGDRSSGAPGEPGYDLKLGEGGIRAIELFVHTLQLIFGARQPELQTASTTTAIRRLVYGGILTAREGELLVDAWLLLRRLENRLQMREEQQTATLPTEPAEYEALARWGGYERPSLLDRAVSKNASRVSAMLDGLVSPASTSVPGPWAYEPDDPLPSVLKQLPSLMDRERPAGSLSALGFRDPEGSRPHLCWLLDHPASPLRSPDPSGDSPPARLLRAALAAPDPDLAVLHLRLLAEVYTKRPSVLLGLGGTGARARLLGTLLGGSPRLAHIVLHSPNVMQEILYGRDLSALPGRSRIEQLLDDAGAAPEEAGPEELLEACRRVQDLVLLRVGLADLADLASVERVCGSLADLSDAVLGRVAPAAEISAGREGSEAWLSWLVFGRHGAKTPDAGSDIDLVGTYGSAGLAAGPVRVFRAARRLVTWLGVPRHGRPLYEVDTRLRPSGNQGVLVVEMATLSRHYREEAEVWERLAVLRARVAVPAEPGAEELLEELAYLPGGLDHETTAREVEAMRQKMIAERRTGPGHALDLKLDPGGLVTADFLCGLLQRTLGPADPSWRGTSTLALLDRLGRSPPEVLAGLRLEGLGEAFRTVLRALVRLRWFGDRPGEVLDPGSALASRVGASLGHGPDAEPFLDSVRQQMSHLHRAYARVCEVLGATAE